MTTDPVPTANQTIPRLILLVALCTIVGGILTGIPLQSANDRSRWATVWSLVHRRTWQIDEIDRDPRWSTIDKVRHRIDDREPFHFYSSKPPLLSSMAAAVYDIQRRVFGLDIKRETLLVTRGILLLINGLPMALALWLFQRLLTRLDLSLATQCFVVLLAGFGSMMNPYLSTLNNHTPAAVCLLICLVTIVKIQQHPEHLRARDFVLVGLTAALTSCFELPAAFFGVVSLAWMLKLNVRMTLQWYPPAALLPLSAYFITNWLATGGILPFYAYYGTDKYLYVHQGMPSYWKQPQGLDANSEGTLTYLFHCIFGHHGVFTHTPAYLLSVWGWLQCRQIKVRNGLTWMLPVGALVSVVVLGFYLTRTENYNYGGNSVALRWILWLAPFWWFALLDPVERLMQSGGGRVIGGVLLSASVITATISLPGPWRPSWIYQVMSQAGWIDYRTPVVPFLPARHSVFNSWPEAAGLVGTWTLEGAEASVTLRSRGRRTLNGRRVCDLEVSHSHRSFKQDRVHRCCVLLDEFESGQPAHVWLRATDDNTDFEEPAGWVLQLMQGLPSPRAYRAAGVRWFQQTPDSHGFRCERAASRVSDDEPQLGPCWHRCDVWYCDDVPFGVLRWKQTLTQESSGEVVQVRTWNAQLSQ